MPFAASFIIYLVLALLIDALAVPRGRFARRPPWALAMAVLALAWLYAAWFAVSWRPVFAASAGLIAFALLTIISNHKFRYVQEPLNFMDFVLVPQIWRHPHLYQAEFLRHPLLFVGVAAVLGYIVFWCHVFEPSLLPDGHFWDHAVPLAVTVAAIIGWIVIGPLPASFSAWLQRRMTPADSARDVRDLGLATSLVAGLIAWRHATASPPACLAAPAINPRVDRPPIVIAVQSESFVDLQRAGLRDVALPALAAARAHAVAHGRVRVPVQGAWTLRSEFVFLSGRPLETFGLDALHPYLRLPVPPRTLAHLLRDAGFATMFVHPYDLRFFNRRGAMPKLGFDRLLGEEDFAEVSRDGYFVPDMAVAERVLSVAANESRPFFGMVATMENHHPWDKNRMPGGKTPVEQYVHHLHNADRMIARLVAGIGSLGRPAVLAFYGDHVPTLPALADPFPDPCTDYFVMGLRDGTWLAGEQCDRELHELAGVILETLEKVCGSRI